MAVIQHAAAVAEGDHGGADLLGQRFDLGTGVQRAAADPDHRRPGPVGQFRQRRDLLRVRGRIGEQGQRVLRGDLGCGRELVQRHFQRDRAAAAGQHFLESTGDFDRGFGGVLDPVGVFEQASQGGELVGQFVQHAAQAADHRAGHLAGETEDGRVHPPGGGQRRGGVQHAGAGHDGIGGGAAGRAGIAEGHVSGGLLVAGVDQAHAVGVAGEGVEQAIDLHAGQAEDGVDAVAQNTVNDGFAAGHARHWVGFLPVGWAGGSHDRGGWGTGGPIFATLPGQVRSLL